MAQVESVVPKVWTYYFVQVSKAPVAAGKRGLANTAGCAEVSTTWYYDWSLSPPECPGSVGYPMFWCIGSVNDPIPPSDVILTFNEPDGIGQCNKSPVEAVEPYRVLAERFPDRELVSPAVAAGLGNWQHALDWLIAWRDAYIARYDEPPPIGSIGVHWYGWTYADAKMVIGKFEDLAREWGIGGISLTEFAFLVQDGSNCNGWAFDQVSVDARRLLIDLDSDLMVVRYAWFATKYNPEAWFAFRPAACNAPLFDWTSGQVTKWGELYRGY